MEGTRDKTPEELEDAIGLLGAGINVEAGDEDITISANTLARNYDKTLSLVEEILLEPRFDPAEFERIKKRLLTRLKQQEGDAPAIASTVSRKMLYGDEHILGIPASGTIETVSAITLDDVKAFYNKNVSPTVSAFHVAGDISQSEVIRSLQRLTTSWDAKQVEWPEYKAKTADEQSQLYFIDVPGAKQSVIIGGQLTFPGASEDYNNLVYANDRLGAGSSARLFQLLRIEKGYTYGAYSYILRLESMSALMAQTSVRANVTKESLDLLTNEIEQYKDTFTQDDFATTQNIVIKRQTREFEILGSLLGVLEDISRFDLPLDYLEHEQQELSNLELSDFKQTIQQYMNPKRMDYLVVGDAKTQLERLGELGLGKPIQLDIKGNQINN